MDEEPELPEPVPEISRGALWTALILPPVITLVSNLVLAYFSWYQRGGRPEFALWVPPLVSLLILGLSGQFHRAVKKRYRERSLVFLNFAYILGQSIVCLSLWIGTCLLFAIA